MSHAPTASSPAQSNGHRNGAGKTSSSSVADREEYSLKDLYARNSSGSGDSQYLESVVRTDVGKKYLQFMQPELSRAHQLSNRNEAETWEWARLVEKRTWEFLAAHPPKGSDLVGPFREALLGDGKNPLTADELREVEALEQVIISKGLGGRDMSQQSIIRDIKQEITRENRTSSSSQKGGFVSKLLGGN